MTAQYVWQICKSEDYIQISKLLLEGWEPFSATLAFDNGNYVHEFVWLRRLMEKKP